MKSPDLDVKSLRAGLGGLAKVFGRYASVLLFLLFMGVYSYIVFQINTLSNPAVSDDEIAGQVETLPTPRIDEEAARKLQSLKDNSVNVQTLFEQGRTNPFN